MRNRITVKVDKEEYSVNELTVKEILDISSDAIKENWTLESIKAKLPELLSLVTDAKIDDLIGMPPSDIKVLYDAFMEVNADFFVLARTMGLTDMLSEMREVLLSAVKAAFGEQLASL